MFESSVKEKDHQTNVDGMIIMAKFESSVKEKDHQTIWIIGPRHSGLRAV